ncbi:MAG: hypothetical protein EZS28_037013, partial [Streblomastix strix]
KLTGMSQRKRPPDTQGNFLNQTNTRESTQSDTVGARKKEQKEKPQLSPADAWLKSFTGQNGKPDKEKFKDHYTELRNEVFSHCYGKPMRKSDATGERASDEVGRELCGQSKDVQSIVGETKEAGAWQTIAEDRTGIMNAFLSIHYAARILKGNAHQRREVAVAPKDAKKVLSGDGSIMSLFGDESKRILAEVVKTQ